MSEETKTWRQWAKHHPAQVFGLLAVAGLVLLFVVGWFGYKYEVDAHYEASNKNIAELAQYGDSFGFVNSIVSSVSALLVGIALIYQIRELSLLKEEIKNQRKSTEKLIKEAEEANDLELTKAYNVDEPLLKYATTSGRNKEKEGFSCSLYFRNHRADIQNIRIVQERESEMTVYETEIPNCANLEQKGFKIGFPNIDYPFPEFRIRVSYLTQAAKSRSQIYAIGNNLNSWTRVSQHPGPLANEDY